MSASKRPSTSSLRRFICSRPYVPVAEIRRRFGLDDAEGMFCLERDGQSAFVGLPEREGLKIQDLLDRDEIGVELSVEVNAPVVVGVYPTRIARYVMDVNGNGQHHPMPTRGPGPAANGNGFAPVSDAPPARTQSLAPR
jgi:hypothetical protein